MKRLERMQVKGHRKGHKLCWTTPDMTDDERAAAKKLAKRYSRLKSNIKALESSIVSSEEKGTPGKFTKDIDVKDTTGDEIVPIEKGSLVINAEEPNTPRDVENSTLQKDVKSVKEIMNTASKKELEKVQAIEAAKKEMERVEKTKEKNKKGNIIWVRPWMTEDEKEEAGKERVLYNKMKRKIKGGTRKSH